MKTSKSRAKPDEVKTRNGPCSEFGDGKTYRGHSMADFYTSAPAAPAATTAIVARPMVSLNRVLQAFDEEIARNLKNYRDREDMAQKLRAVLAAVE